MVVSPSPRKFSIMTTNNSRNDLGQTIEVPLTTGSRVVLLEESMVEKDDGEIVGGTSSHLFEDYVEQYVPETGKLSFEESNIERAEFTELLDEAVGVKVVQEEDVRKV